MIYEIFKYGFILLMLYVCYFVYSFVVKPYIHRKVFQRYCNVVMTPRFVPLLGDAADILKNKETNKFMFWAHIQNAVDNPDCDIKFGLRGSEIRFHITSSEGVKQFIESIPTNVDRGNEQDRYFGKLAPLSFGSLKSTQN